jgi:UDP-N-acetylmuramoyl-tripeptide--D-alanyl-D-alanine ligase
MLSSAEITRSLGSMLAPATWLPGPARFSRVTIDSRHVRRNDLFVALKGERHDGLDFVHDAVERGATGLLVSEAPAGLRAAAAVFVVPDTLAALQRLAAGRREQRNAKVIGVTGSVGKTTTKEILAAVLGSRYRVLKNEANYNNEIGLPLTLLNLTRRHERAVLEMGMYALGEIRTLCEIARPEIGVVTNVGPSHLERLGSLEAIAAAKSELPESLPPHGFAVLNADDPLVLTMTERTRARSLTYGKAEDADVRATDIESRALDGVSFHLRWQERSTRVNTVLPGRHIVSNALAAAAVALVDGMSIREVADALESARMPLRLQIHPGKSGSTIIDDTYNASPASMAAALDLLAETPGRRVAVLGDMRELGAAEREGHLAVGRRAAETADVIHTIGDLGEIIAEAALAGAHREVHRHDAKEAALEAVRADLRKGDVVLVKGSRAMALETVVEALREA